MWTDFGCSAQKLAKYIFLNVIFFIQGWAHIWVPKFRCRPVFSKKNSCSPVSNPVFYYTEMPKISDVLFLEHRKSVPGIRFAPPVSFTLKPAKKFSFRQKICRPVFFEKNRCRPVRCRPFWPKKELSSSLAVVQICAPL